jgi:hypothetical protein
LLLLDYLDCYIFAFFPFDSITIALLDLITVKQELLDDLGIGEPLILREVELDADLGFVLALMSINSLQVFQDFLVFVCDFEPKFAVLKRFSPVILEFFCL